MDKSRIVNDLKRRVIIEPSLCAFLVEASELFGVRQSILRLDKLAILKQEHLDGAVDIDVLHFLVDALLFFEALVLPKLLTSK